METPTSLKVKINLLLEHPEEVLCHHTSSQIETHLHINPKDIQEILTQYENDSYFKNIIQSFPENLPFIFKNFHHNLDGLIFFEDSSGRD